MLKFDDILGHEQIKEHLKNAIKEHKVSHAYIFSGEAGLGKKSLANAFALTLLCEKGRITPCMECPSCKRVISGNHPDLIYVKHEKKASIGVDEVRFQINNTVQIKPYSSLYKIYIIDEAEKLTVEAQNALLKTIEEPPSYAVILLLAANAEAFLPTILSRCVKLKLKPLQEMTVQAYLQDRMKIPEAYAMIYASFTCGNLGKAISIASSDEFKELYREMLYLLVNVQDMEISEFLEYIHKLKDKDYDISECLDFIQMWYRDILLYKVTNDINLLIFKEEYHKINSISQKSSYYGLNKIMESIDKARTRLDANVTMDLVMELLLLVMKEN